MDDDQPVLMDNARQLCAHLVANLSAGQHSAASDELIVDVVRGVLDEHRQDGPLLTPASLLLDEAQRRLERLQRARSDTALPVPILLPRNGCGRPPDPGTYRAR
jgi:hypothetical protein